MQILGKYCAHLWRRIAKNLSRILCLQQGRMVRRSRVSLWSSQHCLTTWDLPGTCHPMSWMKLSTSWWNESKHRRRRNCFILRTSTKLWKGIVTVINGNVGLDILESFYSVNILNGFSLSTCFGELYSPSTGREKLVFLWLLFRYFYSNAKFYTRQCNVNFLITWFVIYNITVILSGTEFAVGWLHLKMLIIIIKTICNTHKVNG